MQRSGDIRSAQAAKLPHPQLEPIVVDSRRSFFMRRRRVSYYPLYWHYHPELEISLFLEGRGLRLVGDSVENFEEGDLCLLGANLLHSWVTSPKPGRRAVSIYVQFLPECLGVGFFHRPEMKLIWELFARSRLGLCFHGKTQSQIMPRLMAMARRPAPSWRKVDDLLWILGTLAESGEYRSLASEATLPWANDQLNHRLNRALHFMTAEEGSIPSQSQTANELGLSPAAFSRFFRQSMGKTYAHFRNELRVSRACRLLLETDWPVTQVAMNAGFNNLSNFNAQFHELKGITPRAYRRGRDAAQTSVG